MAKTIKFTEEEVESIVKLRNDVTTVFNQLGQLAIEKNRRLEELDRLEQDLVEKHKALVEDEKTIFKGLNEKYGDGNYNPETNEFTPAEPKEEVSSEEN
jgi:hypothetical protein|tara:strand:- start:264 stop:560 length:297 start_codon:yes stop_codon:yes gene_type:complete